MGNTDGAVPNKEKCDRPSQCLPSVSDILSEENLAMTLKPAARQFLKFMASIYPQRFHSGEKWFDELYMVFKLVIENYYLTKYGASFSENFYCLKRISAGNGEMPVSGVPRIRSLLSLVIVPYLQAKLDSTYEKLKLWVQSTSACKFGPFRRKIVRTFVTVFPWIKWGIAFWAFILQFGYIFSYSSVHSPALFLAGVRLERLTPDDISHFEETPAYLKSQGLFFRFFRFLMTLPGWCGRILGYVLFFTQFLDYYYNSFLRDWRWKMVDDMSTYAVDSPHFAFREGMVKHLKLNKCPICHQTRRASTVLSVSGYVFCERCIREYVTQKGRCPVTSLPASPANLIRLYTTQK
ncbi:hypothetical protein AB6A40_005869 [Gnathostoma spinigerum]|uniref:Peroxisome assembly protein 12 n=1 Tax=Gnathostoma spinigerum TaxID=75299 RepID=A0ABD6EGN9_9BILA